MAAGFTIETSKISNFKVQISNYAQKMITADMLEKSLRIDMSLPLSFINFPLYELITKLAPYGLGNPEPVFTSEGVVQNLRTVGADGKHLKLVVSGLDAIAFNQAAVAAKLKVGQEISLAYCLALDTYNGNSKIQLKVKDIAIP